MSARCYRLVEPATDDDLMSLVEQILVERIAETVLKISADSCMLARPTVDYGDVLGRLGSSTNQRNPTPEPLHCGVRSRLSSIIPTKHQGRWRASADSTAQAGTSCRPINIHLSEEQTRGSDDRVLPTVAPWPATTQQAARAGRRFSKLQCGWHGRLNPME